MRSELKGLSPLYSLSGEIGLTGLKKIRSLQAYLPVPSPKIQLDRKKKEKSVNKEKKIPREQINKFTDNMD